jgi:hypothetical protein
MPPSLVMTLKLVFAQAAKNDWGSDRATPTKLNSISVLLGAIRPNSSGLIPAATVKSLIDVGTLPLYLRPYVDRYLSGTTITKILGDIDTGKYTPQVLTTPPVNRTIFTAGGSTVRDAANAQAAAAQKLADAQAAQAAAALAAQQAQTAQDAQAAADATARANQAAADAAIAKAAADAAAALAAKAPGAQVECTDGYFRDASGLCVPNAAQPGPAAQPDASVVYEGARLPSADPGSAMIDGHGATRTCPDGSIVSLIGGTCPPTVAAPTGFMSSAPLGGVGLKWWVLGAAGLGIAAIAYRSSNKVTANSRRRRKGKR